MRGKTTKIDAGDSNAVVKLGMDYFTTEDLPYPEPVVESYGDIGHDVKKTEKREKKDGRFYKFVKKYIFKRRGSSNDVKEIHIVPDGDELKWARRSAGSAASRSSSDTAGTEADQMEVVHDMVDEYNNDI